MSEIGSIVIVGAGMAGTRAAEALRTEGFDGSVTLLDAGHHRPYDHVPLSKQYLLGEPGYHRLSLHDDDWYDHHDIDLRLGTRVVAIDTAAGSVVGEDRTRFDYDRLLLATGAAPRRLDVAGADLVGVHQLRTLDDAEALKTALHAAERLVVIGDGFIGCEITASARELGLAVTMIGRGPLPMHRALGERVATFFRDVHLAHGVTLRPNSTVTALEGKDGHVSGVVLGDGSRLEADMVVVGIGAVPRTGLAADAGITVDDGVVTDEFLRTDAPGVYAAGDIASVRQPGTGHHVRREHWATALHHGPAAARNMLGAGRPFDRVPFFFTDQYDVWMEFTGTPEPDDELVIRGDIGGGEHAEFVAFWLRDGRLSAGMNVNITGLPTTIRTLIDSRRRLEPDLLIDPGVDLATLASG